MCRLGLNEFQDAFAFGSYEGTLRELIHLFKYGRIETLAGPLGKLAARALPTEIQFDAIVPVPLHWFRRMKRRFNQSELIAREVSKRIGAPVWQALKRQKQTSAQAGLTAAKRRTNMQGAFTTRPGWQLEGKHILLIDDVLTTGATVRACAAALKKAGARRVTVLTIARADRRLGVNFEDPLSKSVGVS